MCRQCIEKQRSPHFSTSQKYKTNIISSVCLLYGTRNHPEIIWPCRHPCAHSTFPEFGASPAKKVAHCRSKTRIQLGSSHKIWLLILFHFQPSSLICVYETVHRIPKVTTSFYFRRRITPKKIEVKKTAHGHEDVLLFHFLYEVIFLRSTSSLAQILALSRVMQWDDLFTSLALVEVGCR